MLVLQYLWIKVKSFTENESGIVQTAIIIGVLALIAIATLTTLRTPIKTAFTNIVNAIQNAGTAQ